MRTPKPWYRRQNDKWYICLGGQQILLAEGKANKKEAERAYFRLMAAERKSPAKPQPLILMALEPVAETPEVVEPEIVADEPSIPPGRGSNSP